MEATKNEIKVKETEPDTESKPDTTTPNNSESGEVEEEAKSRTVQVSARIRDLLVWETNERFLKVESTAVYILYLVLFIYSTCFFYDCY